MSTCGPIVEQNNLRFISATFPILVKFMMSLKGLLEDSSQVDMLRRGSNKEVKSCLLQEVAITIAITITLDMLC